MKLKFVPCWNIDILGYNHNVTPRDQCARCPPVIRCCRLVFACVLHFSMSSSAFHLHVFQNLHPTFSPLSVLQSDTPMSPGAPFCLFSCAGVKRSRNGPRFAKRPWYTTGRPSVKFRAILSPFDTPMINRGTVQPLLCAAQHPSKVAKTHPNPLHALGRSITIVWAKTVPHLEFPSSLYL